ncbi:hypothetical protein DSM107003_46370 [Trichormus variabilis SAG 1403-4b]|uniref:Uncharacterized protein n=1 Tax=Trichormus variabilis SAG 1403-4b TaxID=447716 RepID=A0A3S1BXL5_ANAVA|nr:hypothetical protein DSM107003_46370 [Trichormus variabilis SAG 1403-4b]
MTFDSLNIFAVSTYLRLKIQNPKYLSKINCTFFDKTEIAVFLVYSLFPIPSAQYEIYFA